VAWSGGAFDHWDSRAGDPQLHTHVVVINRVQSEDGGWRTLDSRGMFRATVGLSEMYNGVLPDFLTQALGWGWESTRRLHSQVPGTKLPASHGSCRRSSQVGRLTSRSLRLR